MKSPFKQTFTSILTGGLVFILSLFITQSAVAQSELLKLKNTSEVKDLAEFAELLATFYSLGDSIAKINTGPGTADPDKDLIDKFLKAGFEISFKDRIVGAAAEKLLKHHVFIRDEKELKKELDSLLKGRYMRPFFSDITKTVNVMFAIMRQTDSKRIKADTEVITSKPSKLGFYKPKFSCSILATAVLAAELRNANKTAAAVDSFFKAVCSPNSTVNQ